MRHLTSSLFVAGVFAVAAPALNAKTITVVTFNSEEGLILLDSVQSMLPLRLFEALPVEVTNDFMTQRKIYDAPGGEFRIACAALSFDYTCTVSVYPGEHAELDFDRDAIALVLPAEKAAAYAASLSPSSEPINWVSEDGLFRLAWSKGGPLTIDATR